MVNSFVWLFNGASRGTPSATPVPTKNSAWYINAADSESGNWTISINESNPPVTCVLAPSNSEGDVLKLLTTGSCSDSTDADVSITCQTCGNDGSSGTACTIFVPGHDECVNVPGDSDGNPDIRTAECTGSPQQLWDIVPNPGARRTADSGQVRMDRNISRHNGHLLWIQSLSFDKTVTPVFISNGELEKRGRSSLPLTVVLSGTIRKEGSTCTVRASTDGSDDAPAILEAFRTCGRNGMIELHDPLYNIDTVMETVGLSNVHIDLTGRMLWSTNITYWRNNSLPLPYQNQTTAWVLGGDNVVFDGHNVGTFDGNGQVWLVEYTCYPFHCQSLRWAERYDFAGSISNLAGRPISLTITNSTNSHYTGIRFVQSQFWSMAVNRSEDILLENIYVNSTSNGRPVQNTDGVDTFYSNRITFRNWTVTNGDDSISFKANSTNMLVQDCTFFLGEGIAIGSIGQMDGVFEFIQNVTVERVLAVGTRFAAYVKTFTGVQQGFPPNGKFKS
ncbi:hypothetical protein D9757_011400 [Collybiopsis confluens]|uniref:Uncharacterized protein n=1 Tax=Collybiopsis confluens TaxID=2823264 RepID=A0A8H5LKA9_9AGAR|nr:hypothetical protein D9757_011400 [Collybiopsis confluens]